MRRMAILILLLAVPSVAGAADEPAKSPSKAFWYSFGATMVPIGVGVLVGTKDDMEDLGVAIAAAGVAFGPSAGHIYAGRGKKAMPALAIRTLATVGAVLIINDYDVSESNGEDWAFLALSGLAVGLAASDILGANNAALRANESESEHLAVVPFFAPRTLGTGLALTWSW